MVEVIIFFVGLTLWSEKVPNECGLKAILPTVVHQTGGVSSLGNGAHVQDHKAAIVFSEASYVGQTGWGEPGRLQRGPNDPVYRVVWLDGDHVRFETGGAPNYPASLAGLVLPQLKQQLCPTKLALRSPFKPPYGGAAAVIALPEGKLQACVSLPADSPGRLDTQLDLKTNGILVISASAMRTTKELRLQADANGRIEVMIANVPATYYDNDYTTPSSTALNGASHMRAYESMIDPLNTGSCNKTIQQWFDELQNPDPILLCDALKFPASGPVESEVAGLPPMTTVGASFDCSNTQFP